MIIKITVKNKIAMLAAPAAIVCGNSDYSIQFDFDAEWQPYETKTARFVISGKYIDTIFSGAEVAVPIISDARVVAIGVYAGNLHTTTPALIMCDGSITSEGGSPSAPSEDVYAQIMEMLNRNSGLWYPSVESGVLSWAKSSAETSPTPADIRGPAGPMGATGPAGKDGAQGPEGPQGIQGVAGPRGEAGVKGERGEKGDTGAAFTYDMFTAAQLAALKGPQGVKGDTGDTGPKGETGANGITPTIGANGNWYLGTTDTGKPSRGATGAKGDTGEQGPQGVKGNRGDPFTYSDFTTEQLAALKGEKGDKGDPGAAGEVTCVDDGVGNLTMGGAAAQTAFRYLQSLTVPGLNFKYVNPVHSGTVSSPYGLYIKSGVSLVDTINTLTEPGIYTAYQNRASTDVPADAAAISSSLRGLVCLSQIKKHYAFIFMVDQDSNLYVQYVRDDVGSGWKKMSTFDGSYNSLAGKPTIPTVQDVLDALPTWTGGSY